MNNSSRRVNADPEIFRTPLHLEFQNSERTRMSGRAMSRQDTRQGKRNRKDKFCDIKKEGEASQEVLPSSKLL